MEKERIMWAVDFAAEYASVMTLVVAGVCTARVAMDMINEGNPLVGWAVFAFVGSNLAIALIRNLLKERLAGAGEAVE